MFVWNVRCTDYPPGFIDVPDEAAQKLLEAGDVQDPRRGALHLDQPEFTPADYQQKVVKRSAKKAAPKKPAPKKKATRKKAK